MSEAGAKASERYLVLRAFAFVLAFIGIILFAGGAQLAYVGGSLYYAITGFLLIVAAVMAWQRKATSSVLYATILVGTLLWAIWEVGIDAWALAPRLIAPCVLALAYLLPGVKNKLNGKRFARLAAPISAVPLVLVQGASAFEAPVERGEGSGGQVTGLAAVSSEEGEWAAFGRNGASDRFSPLTQINPENVRNLEMAWRYDLNTDMSLPGGFGVTPLMVNDTVYICSSNNRVIALDPDTSAERWVYDPKSDMTGAAIIATCRGVAYHEVEGAEDCAERIISTAFDGRMFALDARTGKLCKSFGNEGTVDLRLRMGNWVGGQHYVSSAPAIVNGIVVVGGFVIDNITTDAPPGVVRGYDAATGELKWAWNVDTPDIGTADYRRGTPNSWGPMSVDAGFGLAYVPMGNSAPDHWGRHRTPNDERFGSSIVAIDVATGKARWNFQTVHHDLWDYDVASAPTLFDLDVGGQKVPALVQPTKGGQLFVLDRRTGKPLLPIGERRVPQKGAVPGEKLSPTQPFMTTMPHVAGPDLTEKDTWGISPIDQMLCRVQFRKLRYEGPFTPPGVDKALVYPGIGGGVNWGGVTYDADRSLMIVPSTHLPTVINLVPRETTDHLISTTKIESESHRFDLPQPQYGTPYGVKLSGFLSVLGVPCNRPPYGTLTAIDMRSQKVAWTRPVGSTRATGPMDIPSGLPLRMGMPLFGGTVATRSGLTFMAATQDPTIRAFSTQSGEQLWEAKLPSGGQANPMTYTSSKSGRQYVLIAAGGHILSRSPRNSQTVTAYALPKQ